jgi:hypothetical protein
LLALAAIPVWVLPSYGTPLSPSGLGAIALDGAVDLAWEPVPGADGYEVYRGLSATTITTKLGEPADARFTDETAVDGTAYHYAVRAKGGGGVSEASHPVQATPRNASCSSGNAIVVENCFPGSQRWKLDGSPSVDAGGIEGFATSTSVDAGQGVDLKVDIQTGAPYRIEVYRSGWYGGDQGRLISTVGGLVGDRQPGCMGPAPGTGMIDCSNWATSYRLTTSGAWPTGVYLLRLVREDNGADAHILLAVRDDDAEPEVTYVLPVSNYQAYNAWGGKSLYTFNSNGANTVAGTPRAVKVSFDRPYGVWAHDRYTHVDVPNVGWLERQGYDAGYVTSVDLHAGAAALAQSKAIVSGGHDEYWSREMRDAVVDARDEGTGLLFLGANAMYWKIRFEASPSSGAANRVVVAYKTTESGAADPTGDPTGTWRDPAGANAPENAVIGQQYIGDESNAYFPLRVSSEQGRHRLWRYTPFARLAAGTSDTVGQALVGWEWDAPADNGSAPAGLQSVASSPVEGGILQDAGRVYARGSALQHSTYYRAPSGAPVFATGTNHWSRGLGMDMGGVGEPSSIIMQATANALQDMGARPSTPANVTVDASGEPAVTARTPAPDATGVAVGGSVRATFDRALDPGTIGEDTVTLTRDGGGAVAAAVSYDDDARRVELDPDAPLAAGTRYTVRLGTGIEGWNGEGLASPDEWSFTTGAGSPPTVTGRAPAPGATGAALTTEVTATFDQALDAATVTPASFQLVPEGGSPVAASVSYDASTRTATLVPASPLAPSLRHDARLTTAVRTSDGVALAAPETWSFTTRDAPVAFGVAERWPAPLASGVAPDAEVRAGFTRAVDPATLDASSFTLRGPSGPALAATVGYDAATHTGRLQPSAPLAPLTTYTASLAASVGAQDDDATLGSPVQWTFTTAAAAEPPAVVSITPAPGATDVALDAVMRIAFDRALDPATVTTQTLTLTGPGGTQVSGAAGYDDAARTATFTPAAPLSATAGYTLRATTGIRSSAGARLAADATASFTTGGCPCSLFSPELTPGRTGLDTRDGRPGAGPFSYEMGVKFQVDTRTELTALKFYKDAFEHGAHTGRLWSATGTELASVTFQGESASGWQSQDLDEPVLLEPGRTYVASVGINHFWVLTQDVLHVPHGNGPLRSIADGANGVHSDAAGQFPTKSWRSSNYFVDLVVDAPPPDEPTTPQVTSHTPADGASGTSPDATVRATFNTAMHSATLTPDSFYLEAPGGGRPAATVTYDSQTHTATLHPTHALAPSTTYTAHVTTAARSAHDVALAEEATWTFTTGSGAAPTVTSTIPAADATEVSLTLPVEATFSAAVDPATLTSASFRLERPDGSAVPAGISYHAASRTALLAPDAPLAADTRYTARLTTAVRSAAGAPLAEAVSWSFRTSSCPCSLFDDDDQPAAGGFPTQDGRGGPGPWSYEMGVKVRVTQATRLAAIRFYKGPGEGGTHTGRVWSGDGEPLASTTFTDETASGWQEQALATPLDLQPGRTYVVSVGINDAYVITIGGLEGEIARGPLRSVADGANGVHSDAAGQFPTKSWRSSNYFVDLVVDAAETEPVPPQLASHVPAAGATGVEPDASVSATFDTAMRSTSLGPDSFYLEAPDGSRPAATISYDGPTRTATLHPDAPLAPGTTHTAHVTTGALSAHGIPLAATRSWSFTTGNGSPPTVTARVPAVGAAQVSPTLPVQATFSAAIDPDTLTESSFRLERPGGATVPAAVSYDAASRTASLVPDAPLDDGVSYTARLTTDVESGLGAALAAPVSWSFTTSDCPCRLFDAAAQPAATGFPTQDGRFGPGPWSYEMGVKVRVTQPAHLRAIRFFKGPGEGGTHVGRVWSAEGDLLASTTFAGETASGWQEQALATPLLLDAGRTYVVSVGINDAYVITIGGHETQLSGGPLVAPADGANGVHSDAAGQFPTKSWRSSSYSIDAVVR